MLMFRCTGRDGCVIHRLVPRAYARVGAVKAITARGRKAVILICVWWFFGLPQALIAKSLCYVRRTLQLATLVLFKFTCKLCRPLSVVLEAEYLVEPITV
jgi:hypothetical protein